ncbi:MAG: galactonate dehydratase [Rhizobium sp.]|nr:galactonate dehydratase [Rhizobium sp.]
MDRLAESSSDVANNANDGLTRGFKAIKHNGCKEMQIVDTKEKMGKAVETIAIIREAVDPHIGIKNLDRCPPSRYVGFIEGEFGR